MKIKLKTVVTSIAGITLLAIIGGETYYIVHNNEITKQLSNELAQSENNLKQANILLKEKEENKNVLSDSENIVENIVNNNTEIEETKNNKTIEDVIGFYEAKVKFREDNINHVDTAYYGLALCSNGTYHYSHSTAAESGTSGNYYIDKNGDIILNPLFSNGSGVGLDIISNEKKLKITINEDGSLTDKNKILDGGDINDLENITLKKTNNTDVDEYNSLNKWLSSNSEYIS